MRIANCMFQRLKNQRRFRTGSAVQGFGRWLLPTTTTRHPCYPWAPVTLLVTPYKVSWHTRRLHLNFNNKLLLPPHSTLTPEKISRGVALEVTRARTDRSPVSWCNGVKPSAASSTSPLAMGVKSYLGARLVTSPLRSSEHEGLEFAQIVMWSRGLQVVRTWGTAIAKSFFKLRALLLCEHLSPRRPEAARLRSSAAQPRDPLLPQVGLRAQAQRWSGRDARSHGADDGRRRDPGSLPRGGPRSRSREW